MKRTIVITALLVFSACASTTTTPPPADPGAAIRALADVFDSAMRAGDVEGFMALYADDAVLLPPNAPAFNGATQVRKFWGGLLAAGKPDIDLIVDDVTSSGELAVERGHYELTTPFKDSGKYIVVWRYRGGKWQIIDDMFSSNLAPPSP